MRTCEFCGARLDPNEICDCKKNEDASAGTETPSRGEGAGDCTSIAILSEPYRDVNNLLRLKGIRESTGSMAKDVATLLRTIFPKFTRQLLSQAENPEQYGVLIHPAAMELICTTYQIRLETSAPKITVDKPKKKPNRRLGRKLTLRMTPGDFDVLQKRVQSDGYESVQAWLYTQIMQLLGGTNHGTP